MRENNLIDKILDFLYPQNLNCIVCQMPISRNNKYSLCRNCRDKLIFIHESCGKCGKPKEKFLLEEENSEVNCGYCKDKKFFFERNISFLEYDEVSKKLVFDLKYRRKTYLAKIIAEIMYEEMMIYNPDEFERADYIMYVPLSKKRKKERGFNQAEKIAYYLSKLSKIEINHSLYRKKNTEKLYKMKSEKRKKEIIGAFALKEDNKSIQGKNIILIDDIFTTGTTVNEISKVLKISGVEKIVSLTFLTGRYEE